MMRTRERGQVLVLFAGGMIGLLALAALAIDLSSVYSTQQTERAAADAAALAGAQDLQVPGSRAVGDRRTARKHALADLAGRFGLDSMQVLDQPGCSTAADIDIVNCPLKDSTNDTGLHAAVSTPSKTTGAQKSLQVSVFNPNFQLAFARLFGQNGWNVGKTSVAVLDNGKAYAVITLRPSKAIGNTFNVNDIVLNSSNTTVNVLHGDVGTNANMRYTISGARLNLDPDYGMYYHDTFPGWIGAPAPPAQIVGQLTSPILDPGYLYPDMTGTSAAPVVQYDDARTNQVAASPPSGLGVERADLNPDCQTLAGSVSAPAYSFMTAALLDLSKIYCYNPGVYLSGKGSKNAQIAVGPGDVALLKPGVYYLRSGLQVGGRLIGGFAPDQRGVALMFDEAGPGNNPQSVFNGNSSVAIYLNAGTKSIGGDAAQPAADPTTGRDLVTTGPSSPTPPLTMTVFVRYDTGGRDGTQACVVPTGTPFLEPTACQDGQNQVINIFGGGSLDIEGVLYAPTDNVSVGGSSDNNGRVGQLITWTVTYTGSSTLNQQGPASAGNGVLRLDAACSGGDTPCVP